MADDTRLNTNTTTGDLIVTDVISGTPPNERKVQAIKVMLGIDGANDGYVALSNPLPISDISYVGEDNAASSNPVGPQLMARRRDALVSEVTTDGDHLALNATSKSELYVKHVDSIPITDGGGSITIDGTVAISGTVPVSLSEPISVDDNGGTLTVDAPVGTPVNVQIGDGTRTASVRDTGASDSLNVAIVDAAGNQITSFGGGVQFAEDAASAGGDLMTTAGTVRSDTPAGTTGTDGDYQPLKTDNVGRLWVNGSGVTQPVSDGGSTLTVDDGGSTLSIDDGGGSITIDGSITVSSLNPGTGSTDLGKAEDATHISGDTGVMMLAVRRDSAAVGSGTDGDYSTLNVDANGALRVTGGGGGTEYTEDAASPANPVGNALMLTRMDAGSISGALVSADGDHIAARASDRGALWTTWEQGANGPGVRIVDLAGDSCMDGANDSLRVTIVAGAGSGGTSMTDDAAFTVGTSGFTPAGGTYRSVRDLVDDNDGGAFAMTQRRGLFVCLEDSAGVAVTTGGGVEAAALRVTIASDSTGVLSVDDNGDSLTVDDGGGSITVDGAVSVSGAVDTELPAAAALEDGAANPTTPTVGAALLGYNGATWDRLGAETISPTGLGHLPVFQSRGTLNRDSGGTITADEGTVSDSVVGRGVIGIEITGTWVATLQFEGAIDGTTWFPLPVGAIGAGALVTSTTANGVWFASVAGLIQVRVRASAFTSGTVQVTFTQSVADAAPTYTQVVAQGPAAHNQPVAGNPVLVGALGRGTAPTNVTTDDLTQLWATTNGALCVQLTANGGEVMTGNAANGIDVDVTRLIPGTAATELGKAEDAAHASGHTGLAVLAVRRDTPAVGSDTDGDYSTLNVNASGRLYTSATIDAALPAGTNNIGDVDVLSLPALPAGANNIGDVDVLTLPGVTGAAAHDSAVSGNPLLNGFEARTTAPTAVSNGDAVRGQADSLGKQVVLEGAPHELDVQGDAVFTNTTAADLIAAQGAGIKIVITNILVVNGHATVGTKVEIRDGTTVLQQGFAAPLGGGWSMSNPRGILKSAANAAITGRCVTTGADVDIMVSGYTITNG